MMRKWALVAVPLLVVAWFYYVLHPAPKPVAAATAVAKPYQPSALELADRANVQAIVDACGKPERQWMTVRGRGQYEADTQHILYGAKRVEVLLTAEPHGKEQSRYWIFSGAYRGDAQIEGPELLKRMPCLKPWADAWDAAGRAAR